MKRASKNMFTSINNMVQHYAVATSVAVPPTKKAGRSAAEAAKLKNKYTSPKPMTWAERVALRTQQRAEFKNLCNSIPAITRVAGKLYRELPFTLALYKELKQNHELALNAGRVAFKRVAQEYALACVEAGIAIEVSGPLGTAAYEMAIVAERAAVKDTLRNLERSRVERAGYEVYSAATTAARKQAPSRTVNDQVVKPSRAAVREAVAKIAEQGRVVYSDPKPVAATVVVKEDPNAGQAEATQTEAKAATYVAMAKSLAEAAMPKTDEHKELRQLNIAKLKAMAKAIKESKAAMRSVVAEFSLQIANLKKVISTKYSMLRAEKRAVISAKNQALWAAKRNK